MIWGLSETRRTPRWVRGLKYQWKHEHIQPLAGRTPRWVRGLKYEKSKLLQRKPRSHPTMGAWIEILFLKQETGNEFGRTPRWVRGLKL